MTYEVLFAVELGGVTYRPGQEVRGWEAQTLIKAGKACPVWPKRTVPLLEKPYTKADKVVG